MAALLAAEAASAGEGGALRRRPEPAPSALDGARCGPGFTELPGTRTCLRLGGRVRAEVGAGRSRAGAAVRPGVGGRVTLDARTHTEQGPLRTVIQMRAGSAGAADR